VLKVLRDDFGFDSTRLAATGYGDQHPIAEGDDEASLARNRRVELVIVAAENDSPASETPTATTMAAATTAADRH
jgi:chemotaxis protein MotB